MKFNFVDSNPKPYMNYNKIDTGSPIMKKTKLKQRELRLGDRVMVLATGFETTINVIRIGSTTSNKMYYQVDGITEEWFESYELQLISPTRRKNRKKEVRKTIEGWINLSKGIKSYTKQELKDKCKEYSELPKFNPKGTLYLEIDGKVIVNKKHREPSLEGFVNWLE